MLKRTVIVLSILVGLAVAFVAGLAVGNRWTFSWMSAMLETQVQGTMNYGVEELVLLRHDEAARAIALRETQVDQAMITLPQGREWTELPHRLQQSLLVAQRYRERYPPDAASPGLDRALDFIPAEPIDLSFCRSATRQYLLAPEERVR